MLAWGMKYRFLTRISNETSTGADKRRDALDATQRCKAAAAAGQTDGLGVFPTQRGPNPSPLGALEYLFSKDPVPPVGSEPTRLKPCLLVVVSM